MKTKKLTTVVAVMLLAGAGLANAAEPVALTDHQMDSVAAGVTFNTTTAQSVSIGRFNASIASATALAFAPGRGAVSAAYAGAVGY